MAQSFGKTWWGQQWLNSLNNIDYSNRLPRGSSYANKGAVKKIDIKENRINAHVQGSAHRPYNVDIILPPFFDPELSKFINDIASRPVIISKLLNRELDPQVLKIAEQNGLKVFPKQWTDFKMQCSCPDWAVPCKHLAAVIYKICSEIDNDPFLVFGLHHVDLIQKLNEKGIYVSKETAGVPQLTDLYFDHGSKKEKKQTPYDPKNAYNKLSYSALFPIYQPLSSLLTDHPVFYTGTGNFKEKYTTALGRTVKNAQKILQGKISLDSFLNKALKDEQNINTHSRNKVTIDDKQQSKVFINDDEFSLSQFLQQIVKIPVAYVGNYQPSTASLHTVFHFALHLLANGAVVPQVVQRPGKDYFIRWLPAMLSKEVKGLVEKLEELLPPKIFLWQDKKKPKDINKDEALNLLSVFLTELVSILKEQDTGDIFIDLFFRNTNYSFKKPGEEALCGGIQVWLQKYYLAQGKYKPQIVVEETRQGGFRVNVLIGENNKPLDPPISLMEILTLKKYDQQRFEILKALTQLSNFIPGLDDTINTKGERQILMDSSAFAPFLMQMIPAIKLLDINISLPKSLKE
ncbi:MAG: SWIM zinc finger family protein, partial [Crocinitomicaceae bacterium]|nr:SWIM zinc finger family protein [Crocinitomicaceae bacterium]